MTTRQRSCDPDVRGAADDPAVVADRPLDGGATLAAPGSVGPPGEHQAGRQPLEVPLPRPDGRLVEVVHVEHDDAARRPVEPEVHAVGVAAELRADAGRGRDQQVVGHHVGGTTEVGERRRRHAVDADRHEVRCPPAVGSLEAGDGIESITGRRPGRVARSRRRPSQRLSGGAPFGPRRAPAAEVERPVGAHESGNAGPSAAVRSWWLGRPRSAPIRTTAIVAPSSGPATYAHHDP